MGPVGVTSPTLVSPALHSRGGGACAGGTVQPWAGDTSGGLFTWGGRGQRPPPARRHGDLRSWCIGQRGDVAGKVLGGFTRGAPAPRSPPGSWVLGDPLHPPSHSHPQTQHRHHLASLMGGSPSYKCHPTAHHTQPPPQNSTQKEGGGEGTPQAPQSTQRHSKSTQQGPGSAPMGGWGVRGHGGGRESGHGWVLQTECKREKHPGVHEEQRGASRLWGGGGVGGRGCWALTGVKLGPDWEPCSSHTAKEAQGEGAAPRCGEAGGTGDTSPRWQRELCGGSMPERGRGDPLPFRP